MGSDYAGSTEHGSERSIERNFSPEDVESAIGTATQNGCVTTKLGKYGTPQRLYEGSNGLTVVMETIGRNAEKLITAWWRQI